MHIHTNTHKHLLEENRAIVNFKNDKLRKKQTCSLFYKYAHGKTHTHTNIYLHTPKYIPAHIYTQKYKHTNKRTNAHITKTHK